MVAQFNSDLEVCNCDSGNIYDKSCDAISFNDVSDVVLKGINVTVRTSNISGIAFSNASNISVQSTTVYSRSINTCAFGILVAKAETVQIHSGSADKFRIGVDMKNAINIHITLTTARKNSQHGIHLEKINNSHITDTTTAHNGWAGIYLIEMCNICMNKTITTHNKVGIYLKHSKNTRIINTSAMHNHNNGMYMFTIHDTLILNTKLYNNGRFGMILYSLNNTHIMNTTAINNYFDGLMLYKLNKTFIFNTVSLNNGMDGASMHNMNNTNIINMILGHNGFVGVFLSATKHTVITDIIVMNCRSSGIEMHNSNNARLTNVTAKNNTDSGVRMRDMKNVQITNATASYNLEGIFINATSNINFSSISVTNNKMAGMVLSMVNNSDMTALTALHNEGNAISVIHSRNININSINILENIGSLIFSKAFSLKLGYFFHLNVQISIWSSTEIIIQNSSFVDINPPTSASSTNPSTLPAIIALYQSTLEISECSFKQNHISAVTAHESNITLSGNVAFSNNTAVSGTAFILVQGSLINLVKNSNVKFENNYATNTGGVFYINANDYVHFGDSRSSSNRKCFLNTPVDRSHIQFTFVNNSAGMGGNILYGGQVAFALDGDWNCLESFENISTVTPYQNYYSSISSDPSRVCFCNKSRIPDCMIFSNTMVRSFYRGQSIHISAVTVGQNFGTVTGSVYAQYLKRSSTDYLLQLDVPQKIQSVKKEDCTILKYSIYSPNNVSKLILALTAQNTVLSNANIQDTFNNNTKTSLQQFYHTSRIEPLLYSNAVVFINISILPCPLGFLLKSDPPFKCDCNQLLQQIPGVYCDIQTQTFGRSGLVWVGMTHGDNGINGTATASQYCPLNYCNRKYGNVTLANPDSQCNYNHSGILCGACQPGLSLALGSERCLPCTNKYLTLLIPFTLAGPVLVGIIKFLDLTVSKGTTNGLIFYANVIQANHYIFLPWRSTNVLSIFIAWLNLDLGMDTCFFEGLNAYYKTWLQFIFPFYICIFAGLFIVLSKYSRGVAKVMGNNSVSVLATLFLLSHVKIFRVIISSLSYTILYTSEGHKIVWSADGNVDYLSSKHMLLFVVAVASLLFLWLPYTIIFFLGQWLYMCNCQLIVRFLFKMKPFLDAHYAPLKDKHRYWFGALHLVRAVILLVSSLIPADHSSIVIISILVSAVVLTFVGSIVYQNVLVSLFNVSFFLNLILMSGASFYIQIVGGNSAIYAYTLIGLALFQCIGLVIFNVLLILQKSSKVMAYLQVCMRQHVEDDWELFEQAALLRERESESEGEGSEDSGSMESLPTY